MSKKCSSLYLKALNNPKGLRFKELQILYECAGFKHARTNGSHYIYENNDVDLIGSIQKLKDGKAKPYQVRQLLDFIESHNLMKISGEE